MSILFYLLILFGGFNLLKGEYRITRNRLIQASTGRILGILLLFGAGLHYFLFGAWIIWVTILVVVIIGFFSSKKQVETTRTSDSPPRSMSTLAHDTANPVVLSSQSDARTSKDVDRRLSQASELGQSGNPQ